MVNYILKFSKWEGPTGPTHNRVGRNLVWFEPDCSVAYKTSIPSVGLHTHLC